MRCRSIQHGWGGGRQRGLHAIVSPRPPSAVVKALEGSLDALRAAAADRAAGGDGTGPSKSAGAVWGAALLSSVAAAGMSLFAGLGTGAASVAALTAVAAAVAASAPVVGAVAAAAAAASNSQHSSGGGSSTSAASTPAPPQQARAHPPPPSAPEADQTADTPAAGSAPSGGEGEGAAVGGCCPICMDGARNAALVPCGHTYCAACAARVRPCAICRRQVSSVLRLF